LLRYAEQSTIVEPDDLMCWEAFFKDGLQENELHLNHGKTPPVQRRFRSVP
jgi:hypothetical protein